MPCSQGRNEQFLCPQVYKSFGTKQVPLYFSNNLEEGRRMGRGGERGREGRGGGGRGREVRENEEGRRKWEGGEEERRGHR